MNPDELSKFFRNTEKLVLFINQNNELIWSNKPGAAAKAMEPFSKIPLFKKSGAVNISGGWFYYEILSSDDADFKIVVIENENSAQKLISNPELSAEIRGNISAFVDNLQSILGINTIIFDFLEKSELFDETKYINKSTDKIFKILNSLMNLSELVKYSEDCAFENTDNISPVNVSWLLNDMFEKIERIIFGQNFFFSAEITPNLYVNINQDRFIGCIISLLMYSMRNSKDSEEIKAALAEYDENHVVFSVTYMLSSLSEEDKEPLVGSDKQIVECFCKRYDCVFNKITLGDCRKLELVIPINHKIGSEIEFRNVNFSPFDDKFSRLHIAFSKFIEYKIF
jgi:hypothetical protein